MTPEAAVHATGSGDAPSAVSRRLGLIVNPLAGIGGRVGLKGSDGAEIQKRALELGAVPRALERTVQALDKLTAVEGLEIITYPGEMGEDAARACGFRPTVIGAIAPGATTAQDTRAAAAAMHRLPVDLLLFAGGDGTARDIHEGIAGSASGQHLPVLGIPAGVKIHSAVYATSPASAGSLAAQYLQGRVQQLREAEVLDIDEEAFRQGAVSARLYGYLRVPYRSNLVQSQKVPSDPEEASLAAIAADIAENLEAECLYIIGPGTTTRAVAAELGLEKTLLGVDVAHSREEGSLGLVAADVNETQLLALLDEHQGRPARIVVTPIGGQGYIFGRGNQQISPDVIRQVGRQQIIVVSTRDKLYALGTQPLRVDSGDPTVDEMLSGYLTVVTGYRERAVRKVSA
jgi:predicted polyphosphate/ATP-dependent NAD kinase